MPLVQVSKTATLPVALTDVKQHLRVEIEQDDDYITGLINAAVEYIEQETGRDFFGRTWDLVLCGFPRSGKGKIELPRPPLLSVESVTYHDTANASQTLDSSEYYTIKPTNLPGYIEPVEVWPDTYDRPDAVAIRFSTGSQPDIFKHAVRMLVGHWYESRETVVIGNISKDIEHGVSRLVGLLRVGGYQ